MAESRLFYLVLLLVMFLILNCILHLNICSKCIFTNMNQTFILLSKKNKPVKSVELRPVGMCLLVPPFSLVSFSHATALCRDPVAPDPCVSEEWGQQQHSGVNTFSHVIVWIIRHTTVEDVYFICLICIRIIIDVLLCTLL